LGSYEKGLVLQALDLLGQATERDPHYGPALALAAHCHHLLAINDEMDNLENSRGRGIDLARRALRFAPDDPDVLAFAGFALGYFGEDPIFSNGDSTRQRLSCWRHSNRLRALR
jgi:hypothetical protein